MPSAAVIVNRGEGSVVAFKPRLKNPGRVARHLAQAEQLLADPTTDPARRLRLTEAAATFRRQLDACTRCRRCGRALTDPVSVARKGGPECIQAVAS